MTVRLISFHHRLAHLGGHKYAEVLGLIPEAQARGLGFLLFMQAAADKATRHAFPEGRAVLHDPTFLTTLSFDQRCADFTSMLREHLDQIIRKDDWVFVTTATQCEVRGLVHWIEQVPQPRRPWIFTCFHSDRWNRYGDEERARQLAEFQTLATDLAQLDADSRRRVVIGAVTEGLCKELSGLLGVAVELVPMMMPSSPFVPNDEKSPGEALVAFLGGARPEKGGHRLASILREMATSKQVRFLVQLANEQLSAEQFSELCQAAAAPNVNAVHGALEQSHYRSLVAKADILLLPYDRIPYRQRPSAIFVEGASTGRPIVAPSSTWMADQIDNARAAGVTYEGDDVQAIVAAVQTAAANLPELMVRARDRSAYWRGKMEVGSVLDWFADEIAARQASGARALFSASTGMKSHM
jgi:glycosyltransferase involved in cell wall biosynthesis